MNPNEFDRELDRAQKAVFRHKIADAVLRAVTLGLVNNQARVRECQQACEKAKAQRDRYVFLIDELEELDRQGETVQIKGVRVSRHTFSDLPVVGAEDYGANWESIRDAVLQRDGYSCMEEDGHCYGPLQIHHTVPLSKGGSNEVSNLTTLCLYHHSLKHEHMRGRAHGNIWSRYSRR